MTPRHSDDQVWTALREHQGNRRAAAEALGYGCSSVTNRIKQARANGTLPPDVNATLLTYKQDKDHERVQRLRATNFGWGVTRHAHTRPVPAQHHTPLLSGPALAARWGMTYGDLRSLVSQKRVTGMLEGFTQDGETPVILLFPDNAGILPFRQQTPAPERRTVLRLTVWAKQHNLTLEQALWLERRGLLRVHRSGRRAFVDAATPAPDDRARTRAARATINPGNATQRFEVLALAGRNAREIERLTGAPRWKVDQMLSRLRREGRIPDDAARMPTPDKPPACSGPVRPVGRPRLDPLEREIRSARRNLEKAEREVGEARAALERKEQVVTLLRAALAAMEGQ